MNTNVDLVIYRIPPFEDDGQVWLGEFEVKGGTPSETGTPFTVQEDDPYKNVKWNNIILAQRVEGGSIDLVWYTIDDSMRVCDLGEDLSGVIESAISKWTHEVN